MNDLNSNSIDINQTTEYIIDVDKLHPIEWLSPRINTFKCEHCTYGTFGQIRLKLLLWCENETVIPIHILKLNKFGMCKVNTMNGGMLLCSFES